MRAGTTGKKKEKKKRETSNSFTVRTVTPSHLSSLGRHLFLHHLMERFDCEVESSRHSKIHTPTSSPASPRSHPLQAGLPGLCWHTEQGGAPCPSWTQHPTAPHSGVGGPVEKCPSAADGEWSTAR